MATDDEGIRFNATVSNGLIAFARVVGWGLVVVAAALLATWLSGAGPLRGLINSSISTHACSAVNFLLAGAALLLARDSPRASIACSLLVAVLGGLALAESLGGLQAFAWGSLDAWLPAWPGRPLARMTQLAALSFTLLGVVGAAVGAKRALWLREACAIAVILIATASSASYGLVLAGESTNLFRQLPIMTAVLLLFLALAWLASVPTTGLTRIAVADSIGGAFARRLIVPALLSPVLLSFLFKEAQSQLGVSASLALALSAMATGGVITVMIIWVAFLLDRSEHQRRAELVLRENANTDALTGLANRRMLDVRLAQALGGDGSGSVALLMLDIDHFKQFNDSFGHQAGDEVLRHCGRLLGGAVRDHDLAARYGGEEFVILLPRGNAGRAEHISERILEAFRDHAWPRAPVTVSIGAAVARADDSPEALVERADEALYRSKQGGRDRMSFASDQAEPGRQPLPG